MIIEKGKLLMLSHGEYSDREIIGPYRVLHEFDIKDVMRGFKKHDRNGGHYGFVAYLVKANLIEDMDNVIQVDIGSYGNLEIT